MNIVLKSYMHFKKGKKNEKEKNNDGYALLLSVLVSTVILAIGLGVLNIVQKGALLSSVSKESQLAFYAADSGGECALYWDRKHTGFSATVFSTSTFSFPPSSGVVCGDDDIAQVWTTSNVTADTAETTFDLTYTNNSCVTVVVAKSNSGRKTVINSRGHNTCDPSFPRRVERAIRITY